MDHVSTQDAKSLRLGRVVNPADRMAAILSGGKPPSQPQSLRRFTHQYPAIPITGDHLFSKARSFVQLVSEWQNLFLPDVGSNWSNLLEANEAVAIDQISLG